MLFFLVRKIKEQELKKNLSFFTLPLYIPWLRRDTSKYRVMDEVSLEAFTARRMVVFFTQHRKLMEIFLDWRLVWFLTSRFSLTIASKISIILMLGVFQTHYYFWINLISILFWFLKDIGLVHIYFILKQCKREKFMNIQRIHIIICAYAKHVSHITITICLVTKFKLRRIFFQLPFHLF